MKYGSNRKSSSPNILYKDDVKLEVMERSE